jgi:CheY-like chemotaxis protein
VPDRFVSSVERTRRDDHRALLPTILFADADENYRAMARDALLEGRSPSDLRFATDGQDLLDYLLRRGRHLDPIASPRPALVVLDLELPRLRGVDAVRTIKSNQDLRRIPVVALTHDGDIDAVGAAYDAGINTFLAKPVTFLALVKLMKVFTAYWLETAVLPPEGAA